MRIFYDGFIYDFQQYGGVNRYFNEVIARLPVDSVPIVSTFLGSRDFWPNHPGREIIRARPFASLPSLRGVGKAWMSLRVAATRFDIAHPTYFRRLTPGALSRLRRPLVITVHDMIHELLDVGPDLLEVAVAKRQYIERADAILCVSENTRQDLISLFPQAENRAFVTPLASSMTVSPDPNGDQTAVANPYFLYVGGRDGYKNFEVVLTAFSRFLPRNKDVDLRIVGSLWRSEEQRRIAELGLSRSIIHEGKVDDARLSVLYHRSIALVYPSRYEGFGIPLLEAMRCGTAVISSRMSSLPEVGGSAPLYFEPDEPDALSAQMEALVTSEELRSECVARGALQERKFSWDHTARLTFDVYEMVRSSAGRVSEVLNE